MALELGSWSVMGRRSRAWALGTCVLPSSTCGRCSGAHGSRLPSLIAPQFRLLFPIPGSSHGGEQGLFPLVSKMPHSGTFHVPFLLSVVFFYERFPELAPHGRSSQRFFPPAPPADSYSPTSISSELLPLLEMIYLAWCLFVLVCSSTPEMQVL